MAPAKQAEIPENSVVDYDFESNAEEEANASSNYSIQEVNAELIKRALEKHKGNRKLAAAELGISERTLYRKIKELK